MDEMQKKIISETNEELKPTTKRIVPKIHALLDDIRDSLIEADAIVKNMQADMQDLDDWANIYTPFYLGCYAVFLGSVISTLSSELQPQNACSVGAFACGAGLIGAGGYLIAHSVFKEYQAMLMNNNNEQDAEYVLANGTN